MKAFIAAAGGFCVTLMVFAGGALTAVFFVNAEPVADRSLDMDTTALWTNQAVKVNTPSPNLQRLPARSISQLPDKNARQEEEDLARGATPQATDPLTTTAISSERTTPEANEAHIEWCFENYRSYDPRDNSYNAYSGERRRCISPYSDSAEEKANYVEAAYEGEAAMSAYESAGHVQSCFERYRSYRPEDNTYQPYGGGPRRQCE
ncbi:BA14K family protein [Pseudaminobacter sp. NGMCC 1.201702]|uniref:BA14K family protein n=1 Tax=Pseudaminobacter sp. NGMCC 1.201702 TaxID=3391825 RepID=UPI0039EE1027